MDTSKEYIKMCDCPEVQKQRMKVDENSWYFLPNYEVCMGDNFSKESIWLPRQDQIQEMMGIKTAEGFRNKVDDMFYTRDIGGLYDTMDDEWFVEGIKTPEQLWLAFYMYEKHKKTWNRKQWVKR